MNRLCSIVLLLVVTTPFSVSLAQQYPDRPIRLISPYEVGGGTDFLARLVGQKLSANFGQPVIVENRPGAGGVVGTQFVVGARPDGYTILLASPSPIVVMPYLRKNLGYDPLKDLVPITLITVTPAILVVNPSSTVHSVNDLIALAKSQPGKLSFSSSGIGGTAHLAGEMLNTMTGVSMLHVPYKGTGPANTAVLTGQVTMSFSDMISTLHFVQGGQLRAIAVTSPQRSALLPDVPAISETLPGYSSAPWFGLFAPAGTPPAIIDRINREVARILSAPDMVEKLRLQGAIPMSTSPAEFAAYIKADSDKWGSVIRAANIPTE